MVAPSSRSRSAQSLAAALPAQVLADEARVRVVHGGAGRVDVDGVAEVVGERLVERAGLARVDEVRGVLDDTVGHLVADHVQVGGERLVRVVAGAVHHLGAVPEGVDVGPAELGHADEGVDGGTAAVEAVPAVPLLVVVVHLARRPVGVDRPGVGGVLPEGGGGARELLQPVRPGAGDVEDVLAARVPRGEGVLAGACHAGAVAEGVRPVGRGPVDVEGDLRAVEADAAAGLGAVRGPAAGGGGSGAARSAAELRRGSAPGSGVARRGLSGRGLRRRGLCGRGASRAGRWS